VAGLHASHAVAATIFAGVDLFAPGVGITSSWYTSDTATFQLDGTSMAAPHAAGKEGVKEGGRGTGPWGTGDVVQLMLIDIVAYGWQAV